MLLIVLCAMEEGVFIHFLWPKRLLSRGAILKGGKKRDVLGALAAKVWRSAHVARSVFSDCFGKELLWVLRLGKWPFHKNGAHACLQYQTLDGAPRSKVLEMPHLVIREPQHPTL